ncbi:DgyrCDS3809 [Dimorphilus gyrociliatus]|uniref:DgyrCDS3809 n=1 Tax=Dimorphilus gyrociliatus TaxID=2664684 RepID=A0A7I8VEG5_9ANNE|nr:DgyrCDS3809 [Dimorphilus gyrociliatus]
MENTKRDYRKTARLTRGFEAPDKRYAIVPNVVPQNVPLYPLIFSKENPYGMQLTNSINSNAYIQYNTNYQDAYSTRWKVCRTNYCATPVSWIAVRGNTQVKKNAPVNINPVKTAKQWKVIETPELASIPGTPSADSRWAKFNRSSIELSMNVKRGLTEFPEDEEIMNLINSNLWRHNEEYQNTMKTEMAIRSLLDQSSTDIANNIIYWLENSINSNSRDTRESK